MLRLVPQIYVRMHAVRHFGRLACTRQAASDCDAKCARRLQTRQHMVYAVVVRASAFASDVLFVGSRRISIMIHTKCLAVDKSKSWLL